MKDPVYEVYVQPDFNTPFHALNFNFKMSKIKAGVTYTIKVMNLNYLIPPV